MYAIRSYYALDEQIESSLVHGMTTFAIIHGYGDGILSKGINAQYREELMEACSRVIDSGWYIQGVITSYSIHYTKLYDEPTHDIYAGMKEAIEWYIEYMAVEKE